MLRIIKELIKKKSNLTYCILLLISLILHFKLNYNERIFISKKINNFTSSIYSAQSHIKNYFQLKEINNTLINENAKIKSINNSNGNKEIKYYDINYIPNIIIYNSTNYQKNYILINKGEIHGIKEGMGVVSDKSIVGIVVQTTPKYSKIMSILNSDFKISGKLKKNNTTGNIKWSMSNHKNGILIDLPIHTEINIGDTIITSGYSLTFPEGILLGTVSEIDKKNNIILFSFTENYNKIKYTYVIKNIDMDTLKNMIK